MTNVLLFEDGETKWLDPVTISKPAFSIACGGRRLLEVAAHLGQKLFVQVRPHLRQMVQEDCPQVSHWGEPTSGKLLAVSARLVPSLAAERTLAQLINESKPGLVKRGDSIVAALLDPPSAAQLTQANEPLETQLASLRLPALNADLPTLDYPHDILRHHLSTFAENLSTQLNSPRYKQTANGLFLAAGSKLDASVITDTSNGPIVLDEEASVGPFCYLRGPVHLGRGCRVIEHASIKDNVATGHTVKLGGEIEASIIESYSNKQHHGFLGHSYLGSWVNLGAGTCNSDLKNTYGTVNVEYRGRKVNSGMQFIGTIVGDYAKTAINTGIFTGKTIGVCSMVYGFATTNVPSYVNYARLFGQVTEAPVEVMVSMQQRMFARRGIQQRPCDIQLLHDMHALTHHERAALGQALSIEPLSL